MLVGNFVCCVNNMSNAGAEGAGDVEMRPDPRSPALPLVLAHFLPVQVHGASEKRLFPFCLVWFGLG